MSSLEKHLFTASDGRPFLRWAGGKGRWLTANHNRIPSFEGQYIEPFLGGGSVFFHLARRDTRPFAAWLGDTNLQLIKAYSDIRDNCGRVVDELNALVTAFCASADKAGFYYSTRDSYNDSLPKHSTARFIFLNSCCWNGLWRVNSAGRFNVPFGSSKYGPAFPTPDDLLAASHTLQRARLRAASWGDLVGIAARGDLLFVDPPYFSDSLARSSSTKYTNEVFGLAAHERIADELLMAHGRGAAFVLTNSGEAEMRSLYIDRGFQVAEVQVPRAINSKGDERQPVPELIVTNPASGQLTQSAASALLDLSLLRAQTF